MNQRFRMSQRILVVLVAFLPAVASAQWSLNNDASTLSFVTIKADHVAEVHTFDELSGAIADDGSVEIVIELASVNTLIPIRNERMQAMLFETNLFPRATASAQLDLDSLGAMSAGASESMTLNFVLSLRGQSQSYSADVMVTRGEDAIIASTLKPILVSAESFDLATGVEALREVAGLPSISRAVPVSFTVVFDNG